MCFQIIHIIHYMTNNKKVEHQQEQVTTTNKLTFGSVRKGLERKRMQHSPYPLFLMMSYSTAGQLAAENTNDALTLSATLFPVWG